MSSWQLAPWQLDWQFGQAELHALGGMLGPVTFRLPDGRSLQPMYLAPWADDSAAKDLPGMMRALRGEWPCVPFGRTDFPEGLGHPSPDASSSKNTSSPVNLSSSSPGLTRGSTPSTAAVDPRVKPGDDDKSGDGKRGTSWTQHVPTDNWPHGYSANQPWSLLSADKHHIRIGIDYPETSPIQRLERQISADADEPALDISLTIWTRRDVTLPVALHPTFRVPPEGVDVKPGPFTRAVAYPVPTETNVSRLTPSGTSSDLAKMPATTGTIDLTHLPLSIKTEELLQLEECTPPFSLYYGKEKVEISLWWDQQQLPDVMLWISNGGRGAFPWNNRNYALGVEPVNGAFDLGRVASPPKDHPLARRHGLALKKGAAQRIDYRLAAR